MGTQLTPPAANKPLRDQLAHAELRNRILGLVRNGATMLQVSEAVTKGDPDRGVAPDPMTEAQVKRFVRRYLQQVAAEDALAVDELRVLENERLDAMQVRLQRMLNENKGDPLKITDRLIRISERRSKLNGLDAPLKIEHSMGAEALAEMGADPERINAAEEAFKTAYGADITLDPAAVEEISVPDAQVVPDIDSALALAAPADEEIIARAFRAADAAHD